MSELKKLFDTNITKVILGIIITIVIINVPMYVRSMVFSCSTRWNFGERFLWRKWNNHL